MPKKRCLEVDNKPWGVGVYTTALRSRKRAGNEVGGVVGRIVPGAALHYRAFPHARFLTGFAIFGGSLQRVLSSNHFRFVAVALTSSLLAGVAVARAEFEVAKLIPAGVTAGDEFGRGVSISGDVAVFGAFKHDCVGGGNCGAAYVYRWNGVDWAEEQELAPADIEVGTFFGGATGISGNAIRI